VITSPVGGERLSLGLAAAEWVLLQRNRAFLGQDVIGVTVLKYWYDPVWPTAWLSSELILAEFPIAVPISFGGALAKE
jgi:hypothetical protein